jgi:hypothetical protein
MRKPAKYEYLFVVQWNYGQGWEDVTAEETASAARAMRKAYDANEPTYQHRVIRRRELRRLPGMRGMRPQEPRRV